MKKNIYIIALRAFLSVILCSIEISSQQGQQQPPEFLVGSFIVSSEDRDYTYYNNYEQMLELGLNSVFQRAVIHLDATSQYPEQLPNLQNLTVFPYIYAANDSGTGGDPEYNAKREGNIDWISYFTHAKYKKWEAEGEQLFDGYVMVKHEFGNQYSEGNITGWTSETVNPINEGKFLMMGPNYWQFPRYTFTNGYNSTHIIYKAVFRMKINAPSEVALPVCEIFVTQSRYDKNTGTWILKDTLTYLPGQPKVITLTTNDLSTTYQDFEIQYWYKGFYTPGEYGGGDDPPPPGIIQERPEEQENDGWWNEGSQVQFKVKWLGNRELFVDYIEVYDQLIWENWFIEDYTGLISNVITYNQEFATQNSEFYSKLKYYGTLDEPHVIDCYEPLRKVQEILDEQNINADLLTHWYPGWNAVNFWDGNDPTWPRYCELAQPKKVMFWYGPYVNDPDNNFEPVSRNFTLYQLRYNLQQAHLYQPGFFFTLQDFGILDQVSGNYIHWMTPTPEEVSAGTMLPLGGCPRIESRKG
jgi:hypothetical protein